ncbi:MAG: response regulator [Victivallales bacterium]|nr:response regulator [Victivallales bacterium]
MENRNILCVDDDPNVLFGIRRHLRNHFQLEAATGPEEGLRALNSGVEFAVIVADMQMPGMNGIEFLSKAQEICPDSVRMMLTGNADMKTTMEAINQGHVFRFITKPCEPDDLKKILEAGVRQFQLVTAERELLGDTLNGSVEVLVEILTMTCPTAFSRAARIKEIISPILPELGVKDTWIYEMAAMLSQIGCVTIPPEFMEKAYYGEHLSSSEQEMLKNHPATGRELIAHIPRMDIVAEIIGRQNENFDGQIIPLHKTRESLIALGAQLLRAAGDLDTEIHHGHNNETAVNILKENMKLYNPRIIQLLEEHLLHRAKVRGTKVIPLNNLRRGMILKEDLRVNRILMVGKGQKINDAMLQRLENLWDHDIINPKQMINVIE